MPHTPTIDDYTPDRVRELVEKTPASGAKRSLAQLPPSRRWALSSSAMTPALSLAPCHTCTCPEEPVACT